MSLLSRRRFLATSGGSAAAIVLGARGARWAVAQPAPSPLRVRRSVTELDPNGPEMTTYRAAVTAMQGLAATDRRNWLSQANIHRDHCPHRNWFFLPWHRAYLNYFEQICRVVANDTTFALPYWDWTAHPKLPPAFLGPNNSLAHGRDLAAGDAIDAEFVGKKAIDEILGIADFATFGSGKPAKPGQQEPAAEGQLESLPHDNVHGIVGGDMGGVATSAKDPIFWLHHANIDRLWARWAAEKGHANPSDPLWLNQAFTEFADGNGKDVKVNVRELLSTYDLGYRYADQPETPAPPVTQTLMTPIEALTLEAKNDKPAWGGVPLTVPLQLTADFENQLKRAATDGTGAEVARLTLVGVTPPKDPKVKLRVFVNCPYLSASTPVTDKHYVTTIGFFPGHEGHESSRNYYINIDPALKRLFADAAYNPKGAIRVQVLATKGDAKLAGGDTEITPAQFRIGYLKK